MTTTTTTEDSTMTTTTTTEGKTRTRRMKTYYIWFDAFFRINGVPFPQARAVAKWQTMYNQSRIVGEFETVRASSIDEARSLAKKYYQSTTTAADAAAILGERI